MRKRISNHLIDKNMKELSIELKEDQEYIELYKLLKFMSLANSGGEAKMFIEDGAVIVNDVVETRKRNKIKKGFTVQFNGHIVTVK